MNKGVTLTSDLQSLSRWVVGASAYCCKFHRDCSSSSCCSPELTFMTCCDLDLHTLIRSSVAASEYILSVLSVSFKQLVDCWYCKNQHRKSIKILLTIPHQRIRNFVRMHYTNLLSPLPLPTDGPVSVPAYAHTSTNVLIILLCGSGRTSSAAKTASACSCRPESQQWHRCYF